MKIWQTFKFDKFEWIPNDGQRRKMCQFARTSRYVYYAGLKLLKTLFQRGKEKTKLPQSPLELTKLRPDLKKPDFMKKPDFPKKPNFKAAPVHTHRNPQKELDQTHITFLKNPLTFQSLKRKIKSVVLDILIINNFIRMRKQQDFLCLTLS
ncbi:MAG: hypothetical protein LBF22_04700 [Deltaproteobacteria bacterium]|jgi:hypothetical protein|nr:hypothetical protein [Deltaproteobacteria bacterium]